jgi:transcriptional regulator of aromatic amino acid metabolism
MDLIPADAASTPTSDAALLQRLLTKQHRPNVLVECPAPAARFVLCQLAQTGVQPLHHRALPGALALPVVRQGTLLIENVTALTPPQQQELYAWLTDGPAEGLPQMQVISVATEPLLPAVQEGRFLEALYYRLNIVRMDSPVMAVRPGQTTH